MQKWIPQVFFCQKSTGLILSASDQSSWQCLPWIKIDKDFTHSYSFGNFAIYPWNEKETQLDSYGGMPKRLLGNHVGSLDTRDK